MGCGRQTCDAQVAGRECVMTPAQGDVYTVFLGNDEHFAIIVSEERFNRGDYVIALLVTSRRFEARSKLASCVIFEAGSYCFTQPCVAQAESIAQIRRDELLEHKATLDGGAVRDLVRAIGVVIGAECEPNPCC